MRQLAIQAAQGDVGVDHALAQVHLGAMRGRADPQEAVEIHDEQAALGAQGDPIPVAIRGEDLGATAIESDPASMPDMLERTSQPRDFQGHQQEVGRARLKRPDRRLRTVVEENHGLGSAAFAQGFEHLESVAARKLDMKKCQVGRSAFDEADGSKSVGRFADDLNIAFTAEPGAQRIPGDGTRRREDRANGFGTLTHGERGERAAWVCREDAGALVAS